MLNPDRYVFVNCPFDPGYKQQFDALIFTIFDCGFIPDALGKKSIQDRVDS
jgi:hypothetical protein